MTGAGGDVAAGMAAIVIAAAFGGPDVLSITEEPAAEPGPGQARIAVRAAGVNPVDYKAYSGTFGADPAEGIAKLPQHHPERLPVHIDGDLFDWFAPFAGLRIGLIDDPRPAD